MASSPKNDKHLFKEALYTAFPTAMRASDFVLRSKMAMVNRGFYPRVNTLTCIATCRDEITDPLHKEITELWDDGFDCSSLAGMLFCGKTAFSAAHHHAPDDGKYVYFAFSHIAIDHEGKIGSVLRVKTGMRNRTTACGALCAFLEEIKAGKVDLKEDPDDMEQHLLKTHLIKSKLFSVDAKSPPTLLEMTKACQKIIVEDLKRQVQLDAKNFPKRSYGLFVGIQIHGPDASDYVWVPFMEYYNEAKYSTIELPKLETSDDHDVREHR